MKPHDQTDETPGLAAGFSAEKLRGILLPFTTPFDAAGEVDAPALRSNIERWNETGVRGYVALGSTGERVHLEERECLAVIEAARASIPRHLALIAGAGQESTRATINEVRRFAEAGADSMLVITPHFYRRAMTQSALVGHYLSVADASPVPVVLYNMPDLTGISIVPETVARLSEHENIIGIKDSSSDILNLAEMLRLVPEDFAVLTGNGPLLYAALAAGARGAILAVGCVAARLSIAIFAAVRAGEHERALDLQRRLTPLARAVTTRYGIGGLKVALDLLGYKGGGVRAPLESPGEEARIEIGGLLEEAARPVEGMAGEDQFRLAGAPTS
ncbi:MAG TPA: dihydrodipicolinate synthase family protein [Pyrinomonadaceae bacterium]